VDHLARPQAHGMRLMRTGEGLPGERAVHGWSSALAPLVPVPNPPRPLALGRLGL
jgi:hypothetical protein